ncbi:MFS transporter [Kribbella orskensis]|uniref:MFS transporter n=1 Tax=Kribbella orskensis TaxID=2512216 RepID=A0ABY2BEL9_9ACTN|nr:MULTISPECIES: MFS transporter [Kribbella]TCN36607.1 MFS transporter [Kribbella sp. VKM Ac-2500]TCO17846.1 MFS transporter [Kribbella orskensis]
MSRPNSSAATLAVLSVAQFLIALDYSIIYIALPSVATDLTLDPALAQWVISAYAVLFAGFLVVGGRLTDRLGAKRLFVSAIIGFGLASAVGGVASDGTALLIARGAQGLGAALLQPAILGLIGTTFTAGPARSRALAVWGSVGASGLAAGAILGGVLTSASWRLTFLVNVPLTLLAAVGATIWITSNSSRVASRVPFIASALGTATVLALVIGLTLGTDHQPAAMVSLALAAVLFLVFVRNERRSTNALIERGLRSTASLKTGAAATALYMASVGSEFYVLTLLLQSQKGYTPLQAGLAFLPLAVLVTAGNTAAERAVRRYGPAVVLAAGFVIAAVGLLWLAVALDGTSYAASLLPGLLLSGFGHGVIYTSMFIIGTHDVAPAQQGTAGALLTTSQYLAGALTIAVLTLVLTASPGPAEFRTAFLLTTAAAAGGAVLALRRSVVRQAVTQEC